MSNPMFEFATEMSELTGQHIAPDHIHPAKDRFGWIQLPKAGSPMLMRHYRGLFFIDLEQSDYDKIVSGEISPHMYIYSANWLVGYYWGGASMIGGCYYQPLDIVLDKKAVRRYLKILACRGNFKSSGYYPSSDECKECGINDCPFSRRAGDWSNELQEEDPRIEFFNMLLERFKKEYPPFTLRGFLCGYIPADEIYLSPNARFSTKDEYSFTCYASNTLIQSLLMREVLLTDCDINDFKFKIIKGNKIIPISEENLRKCFDKVYDAAKGTYVKDTSLGNFSVEDSSGEDSSEESSSVKDSSAGVSSGEDSFVEDVFREDKVPFRKRVVTFFTEHF